MRIVKLALLALTPLLIAFSTLYVKQEIVPFRGKFIIPDLKLDVSFDPLDGDFFHNMHLMRILNASIFEISESDNITSSVLEYYSLNTENTELQMTLKENIYFSNGDKIEADDVILTILRMLLARPNFPVIESIVGKEEWLTRPYPLESNPGAFCSLSLFV